MNPDIARFFDGLKYMWDGEIYDKEDIAEGKLKEYGDRGFETRMVEEGNAYLVYNRRVAKEVVVEGPAPP